MSQMGQSRHFDRAPATSGLPVNRHLQSRLLCLKGATNGLVHRSGLLPRAPRSVALIFILTAAILRSDCFCQRHRPGLVVFGVYVMPNAHRRAFGRSVQIVFQTIERSLDGEDVLAWWESNDELRGERYPGLNGICEALGFEPSMVLRVGSSSASLSYPTGVRSRA